MSDLSLAQHEAAHIVVGVALGLRLAEASICQWRDMAGYTWFPYGSAWRQALTSAAGIAIDRALGAPSYRAAGDVADLAKLGYARDQQGVLVRIAWKALRARRGIHARVTRALLERRKITGADINALARGEWVGEEK